MQQWLDWMANNHPKAIRLGLSKLIPIARELLLTSFNCPVVVVGGTNGKGSCIKTIETILLHTKLKVGVYTSPHLLKYNERIRINGTDISDAKCIQAFEVIKSCIEKHNITLTFFEFATLSALLNFQQENLDVILLEIGLGGRLDAVNIVENDIAVLTSIDIDHTDFLGDTRESIAREKSGIFRKEGVVVCGEPDPPKIVFDHAKKLKVDFSLINKDYGINDSSDNKIRSGFWHYYSYANCDPSSQINYNLPKPKLLLQNVATGIKTVEKIQEVLSLKFNKKVIINQEIISKVQEDLFLLGRNQIITVNNLEIVLDVAHNNSAANSLARRINLLRPVERNYAIFNIQDGKDLAGVINPFKNIIDEWHVIDIKAPRAIKSSIIAERIEKIVTSRVLLCENLVGLMRQLITDAAGIATRITVFGSFYTVAHVLDIGLVENNISEPSKILNIKN